MCWGLIIHEMVTLMNPSECEHMMFQYVDIIASFYSHIFRKEVQTCAAHISTKSIPHHYTNRVLYGFNCKFRVKPRCSTWATHHFWDFPSSLKVLSSMNITFLHSAAVQCRYFLQNSSLFSSLP